MLPLGEGDYNVPCGRDNCKCHESTIPGWGHLACTCPSDRPGSYEHCEMCSEERDKAFKIGRKAFKAWRRGDYPDSYSARTDTRPADWLPFKRQAWTDGWNSMVSDPDAAGISGEPTDW